MEPMLEMMSKDWKKKKKMESTNLNEPKTNNKIFYSPSAQDDQQAA